jgi:hypothetical protein
LIWGRQGQFKNQIDLNFPKLSIYFIIVPFKMDSEGLPNVESLLCTMLESGREKCGAHANAGGLPGAELKRIAKHLGIPTAQSKGKLIECISHRI